MPNLGGFSLHIYGLLIGLGIIAALETSLWYGKQKKIDSHLIESGFWWIIALGLIGARLYHVIDLWSSYYSHHLLNTLAIWNGGLGIWGAIIGGTIGLLWFYKVNIKSFKTILLYTDIATIGVPLAQAIGRWGNFFNHELYGIPTTLPWGILNNFGIRVHPLFLYESVLNLALFFMLIKITRLHFKDGVITSVYLAGYGLIRLSLESLRPYDSIWKIVGIPTAQIVSIAAILTGIGLILYVHHPRSSGMV